MAIARSVGIDVFVTGGIGGVHRGAQNSEYMEDHFCSSIQVCNTDYDNETGMDISADLHELAQTPMGVVCAGAKSILDIGLTLEMLVSWGLPQVSRWISDGHCQAGNTRSQRSHDWEE